MALVALAGCGKLFGLDTPIDGDPGGDDAPPGLFCYGKGLVKICFSEEPNGDPALTSGALNTDTPLLCSDKVVSGGTGYCVISAHTISVPAGMTVTATGSKPLVFVATDSITIDGTLDVAGHRGTFAAPASGDWSMCNSSSSPSSGGGGAGGSFAGTGGDGGGPNQSTAGVLLAAPTELHGGCPGRDGSGADGAGSRGHGGGAVYLIAKNQITVSSTGAINASGGGGGGSGDSGIGGGGGGGSGGMVGLDALMLGVSGPVFANGGGGSGGSSATQRGQSGGDPMNGDQAMGGTGGGGSGGDGGFATMPDGRIGANGVAGTSGGGGGGGSVGVILIYGTKTGAGTISPPPAN